MIAVDKVDVGESGRSKQNCIAQRVAGSRVSRRIVLAQVGFHFNNAGGKKHIPVLAYQNFAQEFACYPARVTSKERAVERTNASNFV
jgi:hypothetical protein